MKDQFYNQQLIQVKILKILLESWDPIGIHDVPEAQNEYNDYVFPIYELLISEKSEGELFNYLWEIETQQMGLTGNICHTRAIAKELISIKNQE